MNIVELFAGSRSFSKVAERLGHQTFTSDIEAFDNIDYVTDIFDFDTSKVPFQIDVLWASPPCTYFSVASIGHHWNKDNTPKTENAKLGIEIVKKTIGIISELNPKYFIIENPRGKLRKLNLINPKTMKTVWYCTYGDKRAKPTDIWTNIEQWIPRPVCHNGNKNCHHESAPRGSKTGTQGLKGSYDRSKVPEQLCLEILNTIRDKP
jgi:site-specific DNA-cytosine methylase|tara:strand:- start:4 stop:624 length:621 start_codon:yes stop_codon:yes gene_type:complete